MKSLSRDEDDDAQRGREQNHGEGSKEPLAGGGARARVRVREPLAAHEDIVAVLHGANELDEAAAVPHG